MLFILKPNVDITKYGFIDMGANNYWWRRRTERRTGAINIVYNSTSRRITIYSASSDAVAVLCTMYKNGDMDILPDEDFVNMKLTIEEAEFIEQRRKNQNEQEKLD